MPKDPHGQMIHVFIDFKNVFNKMKEKKLHIIVLCLVLLSIRSLSVAQNMIVADTVRNQIEKELSLNTSLDHKTGSSVMFVLFEIEKGKKIKIIDAKSTNNIFKENVKEGLQKISFSFDKRKVKDEKFGLLVLFFALETKSEKLFWDNNSFDDIKSFEKMKNEKNVTILSPIVLGSSNSISAVIPATGDQPELSN